MAGRKRQSSRPKANPTPPPEVLMQPEAQQAAQLATPLETATANARAFEVLVGKMEQELNEARIKLLKWQGAAEFLASLEAQPPGGPENGKDTVDPLTPDAGDKETGS